MSELLKLIAVVSVYLNTQTFGEQIKYEKDPNGYIAYCPCMGEIMKKNIRYPPFMYLWK